MNLEFTDCQIDELRAMIPDEDGGEPEVCLIIRAKVVGWKQDIEDFTMAWYEPLKTQYIVTGQTVMLLPVEVESVL